MPFCRARHPTVLLAACALAALPAIAQAEQDDSRLRLGVFGTLGAIYHDETGVEYRRTLQQPHGAEAGKPSLGNDSMLGAQINARAHDNVEGVLQVVSQWRPDNSWSPEVTWGFVSLSTDESWVLRLGRVAPEAQMNSDSRLIGYASLPIRPAQELQTQLPTDYLDGGDLKWKAPLGTGIASAKFFYGTTSTKINASGAKADLGDTLTRGLILGYSGEVWSGRIYGGLSSLRSLGAEAALINALRAIGAPQTSAAAETLDKRGGRLRFHGADLAYEPGALTLRGSVLRLMTEGVEVLVPDSQAVAFLAAYRLGTITPYAQYSRAHREGPSYAAGLGGALDAAIDAAVNGTKLHQRSFGAGVRVDFGTHFSLKLQIDRIRAEHSTLVSAAALPAGARKELTLYGLSLDFAF